MRKRTLCKMLDWSTVGWADFVLFGVPLHTGKIREKPYFIYRKNPGGKVLSEEEYTKLHHLPCLLLT